MKYIFDPMHCKAEVVVTSKDGTIYRINLIQLSHASLNFDRGETSIELSGLLGSTIITEKET